MDSLIVHSKDSPTSGRMHSPRLRMALPAAYSSEAALAGAFAMIAHDLRGPLASLSLLIELIEYQVRTKAYERAAHSAVRAEQMIAALDDMLSGLLERIRDTGDPLSFRPGLVDLLDVIREVASLNQPVADSRSIRLDCSGAASHIILGDRRLLAEAYANLVGNALKHAPAGSTVTCAVERRGRSAALVVADQGRGLSADDISRAFRPFTTLSTAPAPALAEGPSSFGLGLWITRLIAERHGGEVVAEPAAAAGGARFLIRLPSRLS